MQGFGMEIGPQSVRSPGVQTAQHLTPMSFAFWENLTGSHIAITRLLVTL